MSIKIDVEADDLQPLIDASVRRAVEEMDARNGRLSYGEKEAAAMLGVSKHALRDARYRNEIPATRLGKSWLYKRADLLAFLDKQSTSDTGRRARKP